MIEATSVMSPYEMLLSSQMNIINSKPISAQVVPSAYEGYHSVCPLMTAPHYYLDIVDLRVEAIITSASPRLLWLQLSGLLNSHNNSWLVSNLYINNMYCLMHLCVFSYKPVSHKRGCYEQHTSQWRLYKQAG